MKNRNTFTGGNVVFKFNNVTLKKDGTFNRDASPLKVSAVNGIIKIPAIAQMRDAKNFTIIYSGSSYYNNATSQPTSVNIAKKICRHTYEPNTNNFKKNITH